MKRLTVLVAALALAGYGLFYLASRDGDLDGSRGSTSPSPSSSAPDESPPSRTRFGVMLSTKLFDIDTRVSLAEELGVRYLRSSAVFVESWRGDCAECRAVHRSGLEFVLTIRNSAGVTQAASPPRDLDAYREAVRRIIRKYRPALVAVENEENTRAFYLGSADDYGRQLGAACEVAHDLDTLCTNGGLLSGSVVFLVYQHYVDGGDLEGAESFAMRAFEPWQRNRLRSPSGREWIETRAREVGEFLDVYGPAGADYVNFHWYVADRIALEEAVGYVEEATGLPAVTNEIGQRDLDPNTTAGVLAGVRSLGLPYAVWFGIDATLARGLVEPDGSLRETGLAFQAFVRDGPT
jgi:hypothetical protein